MNLLWIGGILLLAGGFTNLHASSPPQKFITDISPKIDKRILQLAHSGLTKIYLHNNYAESRLDFQAIQKLAPKHPAGYLYEAAALSGLMGDYRNFNFQAEFIEIVDKTIGLSKKLMRDDTPEQPWGQFYLGGALGLRGLYHILKGNHFRAIRDGIRAYQHMNEVIESNKNFYDAYYGTGLYHFWYGVYLGKTMSKQERSRYINRGITQMRIAYELGTISQVAAGVTLIGFYAKMKRYTQAEAIIKKSASEYPDYIGRFWLQGEYYHHKKDYRKALETFDKIRRLLQANSASTPAAFLAVDYHSAESLLRQGRTKSAIKILTNISEDVQLHKFINKKENPKFLKRYYEMSLKALEDIQKKSPELFY